MVSPDGRHDVGLFGRCAADGLVGAVCGYDANASFTDLIGSAYWQTAITAEIAVTGILTAVFFVLLVLSKTKKKAKKQ